MSNRLQNLAREGIDRLQDLAGKEITAPTLKGAAIAGVVALTAGMAGRFVYLFAKNPGSHSYKAPSPSDSKTVDQNAGGITITVIDNQSSVNPLEAVLAKEHEYVQTHSWQEIENRYTGVPGGVSVIVSLHDYQGNDKEQACKLALGRLVEATIGSVIDRMHPKYRELADLVVDKGLPDCTKDMQLKYKNYRFGM